MFHGGQTIGRGTFGRHFCGRCASVSHALEAPRKCRRQRQRGGERTARLNPAEIDFVPRLADEGTSTNCDKDRRGRVADRFPGKGMVWKLDKHSVFFFFCLCSGGLAKMKLKLTTVGVRVTPLKNIVEHVNDSSAGDRVEFTRRACKVKKSCQGNTIYAVPILTFEVYYYCCSFEMAHGLLPANQTL